MKITAILMTLFTFSFITTAHAETEKVLAKRFCTNGETEESIKQGGTYVKVDCLTPKYAIEVHFSHKWAESIGQALNYAQVSRPRKAAIILICRKLSTCTAHSLRLTTTIKNFRLPISVWYCLDSHLSLDQCEFDPPGASYN